MRVSECPFCKESLRVEKLGCCKCGISFEGEFYTSPIMALSEEQQSFVELFVLNSGSLKEMAQILGVTYPTVRVRLDEIIEDIKKAMKQKDEYKNAILDKVEKGVITPEKAAQIIKNL